MKKLIFFFTITILGFSDLNATHMIGGQITWRCIPSTGQFRFYMELYRNCASPSGSPAAGWSFQTELMRVAGSNLPRTANNAVITTIVMKPDSTVWTLTNSGELSPYCFNQSAELSCSNPDFGVIQRFYYVSDPITLVGVPPSSGWHFYYQTPCCRSDLDNTASISQASGMVLRSVMYGDASNANTQFCYDSSPQFIDLAPPLICRGSSFNYNSAASDRNMDSLSYQLAPLVNGTPPNTAPVIYNAGYSFSSPTPGNGSHVQNSSMDINSMTGIMHGALYNGFGALGKYATCVQVDQWRDGKKIGSIFRELPFYFFDCAPDSLGSPNLAPEIIEPFSSGGVASFSDTFQAGSTISFPITIIDSNSVNQQISVEFLGDYFSTDFASTHNCSGLISSCAVFIPSLPFNVQQGKFLLTGIDSAMTTFYWPTSCSMLGPNFSPKTYYFYVRAQDDHCPIPSVDNQVISITLEDGAGTPCQITTGLEHITNAFKDDVKVFPNPVKDQFNVQFGLPQSGVLRLHNLQGQLLQEETFINRKSLNYQLEGSGGVYFMEIINQEGERVVQKIIKQ